LWLRPLAFATFLVWWLRIGACGVGAYDSYPNKPTDPPPNRINVNASYVCVQYDLFLSTKIVLLDIQSLNLYSREHKPLIVDFCPTKKPWWPCLDFRGIKEETLCDCKDQNIQNNPQTHRYSFICQKEWHIAKSVMFSHPHCRCPAVLPALFCAEGKSTVSDLCSRLWYSNR